MNVRKVAKVTSLFIAVSAVGFLLSACSSAKPTTAQTNQNSSSSATSQPAANAVTIQNMAFTPNNVTVKVGQTVSWSNQDAVAHTVTSNTSAFESGNLARGKTYSFTFTKTGTFPYYCAIHPSMTGQVTVTK